MPIRSYTTKVPVNRTITELSNHLAERGVTMISTMYGDRQLGPVGMRFTIDTKDGPLLFAMPVRVEGVYASLINDDAWPHFVGKTRAARYKHAQRVAWRILHDWALAQFAIVEAEMAELQEVFLPYMLSEGKTLYKYLSDNGFQKALAAPE